MLFDETDKTLLKTRSLIMYHILLTFCTHIVTFINAWMHIKHDKYIYKYSQINAVSNTYIVYIANIKKRSNLEKPQARPQEISRYTMTLIVLGLTKTYKSFSDASQELQVMY